MPSRSGQAKEAGSVHRRGVAVYRAAHGLASRSVAAADPGPGNPTPTALEFETAYATDDLLCTLSDGTRLFISAKRTCGDDAHLRDTLEQWAQLVDELRPDNRLVLATAEPKSIVRHLGPALNRRRNGPHHRLPGQRTEGPRRAACAAGRPAAGQAGPASSMPLWSSIDAAKPGDAHHGRGVQPARGDGGSGRIRCGRPPTLRLICTPGRFGLRR
jgi:hypothetical protein